MKPQHRQCTGEYQQEQRGRGEQRADLGVLALEGEFGAERLVDLFQLVATGRLELATGEPIDTALLRFVDARKRRSQLAAGSLASRAMRQGAVAGGRTAAAAFT
jgi:hypothetical protein